MNKIIAIKMVFIIRVTLYITLEAVKIKSLVNYFFFFEFILHNIHKLHFISDNKALQRIYKLHYLTFFIYPTLIYL